MKEDIKTLYSVFNKFIITECGDKVFRRDYILESIDYKGKSVLDIGSDIESVTAFMELGAKEVCGVNADAYALVGYNGIHKEVRTSEDFYTLIENIKPDIVKIDIEGWENQLLFRPDNRFLIPELYIIEIHPFNILNVEMIYDMWVYWLSLFVEKPEIIGRNDIIHEVDDFYTFERCKISTIVIDTKKVK